MPDKNIVLGKVGNIQRCLRRIQEVTGLDPQTLDGFNVQDIFVLNLQRAVQSTIDLAAHIISSEGLGLPNNMMEPFLILQRAGITSESLTSKMISMVGFRNIAIHDYIAPPRSETVGRLRV